MLDEVIEQIERCLPDIQCEPLVASTDGSLPSSLIRRMRAFAKMARDSILTDDGNDIRLGNNTNGTNP